MASENQLARANNQFGMDLFNTVAKDDSNKLISPFSAHVVLSMTYQGSDGETLKSMANVFHLADQKTTAIEYQKIVTKLTKVTNVTLDIANKIYIQEDFKLKPDFKSIIENKFLAEAEGINFGETVNAAGTINSWVENKTNNRIDQTRYVGFIDKTGFIKCCLF